LYITLLIHLKNILILLKVSQYCVDVRINNIVDETKVKLIKVYGKSQNDDYQFNDTKKFTYKIKNYFTMVETDKPIYKPGDKGICLKKSYNKSFGKN
jgi:hypothetical protein